jgi:hypothetical protein
MMETWGVLFLKLTVTRVNDFTKTVVKEGKLVKRLEGGGGAVGISEQESREGSTKASFFNLVKKRKLRHHIPKLRLVHGSFRNKQKYSEKAFVKEV